MARKKEPQALKEKKKVDELRKSTTSICYGKNYKQLKTPRSTEPNKKMDLQPTQIHSTALSMSPSGLSSSMPTDQTLKNENLNLWEK